MFLIFWKSFASSTCLACSRQLIKNSERSMNSLFGVEANLHLFKRKRGNVNGDGGV